MQKVDSGVVLLIVHCQQLTLYTGGREQMSDSTFNISKQSMKRVELVTVSGRIDSSNAAEFDNFLQQAMADGRHNVVLELSGITYMSSAGLRAIVALLREAKKHRGDVRIATPSDRMKEVLQLAGLDSLFEVYDDETAAVGSF
jgi:anti-anti-sigma factor